MKLQHIKDEQDNVLRAVYDTGFDVSYLREKDSKYIEVALVVHNDPTEGQVIDIVGFINVAIEDGGKAVKLLTGWIDRNMAALSTGDTQRKIEILSELVESMEYTLPTYLKVRRSM